MTSPPVVPPAPGRPATKFKPQGKLTEQSAPREHGERFRHLLEQKNSTRPQAVTDAVRPAGPAAARKAERISAERTDGSAPLRSHDEAVANLLTADAARVTDADVIEAHTTEPKGAGDQMQAAVMALGMRLAALQQAGTEGDAPPLQSSPPSDDREASLRDVLARASSSHDEIGTERSGSAKTGPYSEPAPAQPHSRDPDTARSVQDAARPASEDVVNFTQARAQESSLHGMLTRAGSLKEDVPPQKTAFDEVTSDHQLKPAASKHSAPEMPPQAVERKAERELPKSELAIPRDSQWTSGLHEMLARASTPEAQIPYASQMKAEEPALFASLSVAMAKESGGADVIRPPRERAGETEQAPPRRTGQETLAPLPSSVFQRLASDPAVRVEPKPAARRDAEMNGTRSLPDNPLTATASGPTSRRDFKPERGDRSGGGAADVRPLPVQQPLPQNQPAASIGPAPQNPAPEAAAQQILRHITEATSALHPTPAIPHVQGAARSMRLKLSPENLGEVEIRITREEGQLAIRIRTEQRETAEMLKNDSSVLRDRLEFISAADARVEIEFVGVADPGQHHDMPDGMTGSFQGQSNRQAAERQELPQVASASGKSGGPSQGDDAPDHGQRPLRGRPDVLLL